MSVFEYDAQTGEITSREYTAEEQAQHEDDIAAEAFRQTQLAELAAKRAELLERLGLTENEARTLFG
jgi:hypothetical protein